MPEFLNVPPPGAEAQARQTATAQFAHVAIVAQSVDGTITKWNDAATQLLGYTAQEAIGHPISLIVPPHLMGEQEEIERLLASGEIVLPYESVRRTKDGS